MHKDPKLETLRMETRCDVIPYSVTRYIAALRASLDEAEEQRAAVAFDLKDAEKRNLRLAAKIDELQDELTPASPVGMQGPARKSFAAEGVEFVRLYRDGPYRAEVLYLTANGYMVAKAEISRDEWGKGRKRRGREAALLEALLVSLLEQIASSPPASEPGGCPACRDGIEQVVIDDDGTFSSVSGRPGLPGHAVDDFWWYCKDMVTLRPRLKSDGDAEGSKPPCVCHQMPAAGKGGSWLARYGLFARDIFVRWEKGERPIAHHPACSLGFYGVGVDTGHGVGVATRSCWACFKQTKIDGDLACEHCGAACE